MTAIVVMLGLLLATVGEPLHLCAMTGEPAQQAAAQAGDMPCHGESVAVSEPSMDCCDGGDAAGNCVDCLCPAAGTPASAVETFAAESGPVPGAHIAPLSAAPPPERPPDYLLRPPIVVS